MSLASEIHTEDAMRALLLRKLKESIDHEIEEHVDQIRDELRSQVGNIAVSLMNHYDMSRNGNVITIRVRIDE